MYEDSTAAQNPDSDMIAFRNVGPSARITFISDPGNLAFGPLHDYRILWSEAKQGTTIPFVLDTNIAGIAIDVTIVSDNESSFYSDSLTLQAVPEPGTAALVSTGLVELAPLGFEISGRADHRTKPRRRESYTGGRVVRPTPPIDR